MPARPVIELSTYVLEPLWKDAEFILYRGRRENDGSRLLLATPVEEHPRPESLKLLDHAYTFEEELDTAWAARPIAITRYWDRPVLVMEDPGGVPLDQLLGQPLDIELSLRLASPGHRPQGYQAGSHSSERRRSSSWAAVGGLKYANGRGFSVHAAGECRARGTL
jgi:hypothetical protein